MKTYPGRRVGRLVLVRKIDTRHWLCMCDCGTAKEVDSGDFAKTHSCGCLRRELMVGNRQGVTHGGRKEQLYGVWKSMRERCFSPNHPGFHCWGGRGITVCEEWADSYSSFREWASHNGYGPGLQIDRIDNDGNYEPTNCRFVTAEVNANNRRSSRFLSAFGETKSIMQWSKDPRCSIAWPTLYYRIDSGMPPEQAISSEANKRATL